MNKHKAVAIKDMTSMTLLSVFAFILATIALFGMEKSPLILLFFLPLTAWLVYWWVIYIRESKNVN